MRQASTNPIPNCIGAYVLHHPPSGLCLVGVAADLLHAWSVLFTQLERDMHLNAELQDAYTKEPYVEYEFFVCVDWKEADATARAKRQEYHLNGRLVTETQTQLHPPGYTPPAHQYNA